MKQINIARQNRRLNQLPIRFILVSVFPALILTTYFTLVPAVRSMIQSLTTATTLGGNSKFVGFENYVYMFSDKNFLLAMVNSLKLMAVVPITTLFFSLLFASILVQGQLKEKGFYRTLLFFPSIVSMTVVAIVWSFVFHPTMGILTTLMKSIGLGELVKPWLGDSSTALWCVGIALIWQAAGYYMVMHIAAMDSVSPDVYEAATIDGAGKLKQFLSITLPLIRNIIGITYILSLSGTINLSFILSNVMTAGGPNGASNVLLRYMYTQGMVNANFGYAMSISVFTLFISIILSLASRKMTSKQEG